MRKLTWLAALLVIPNAWSADRTLDSRATQEAAKLLPFYESMHSAPELSHLGTVVGRALSEKRGIVQPGATPRPQPVGARLPVARLSASAYADLEFLSGFIALRRLNDPATALRIASEHASQEGQPLTRPDPPHPGEGLGRGCYLLRE